MCDNAALYYSIKLILILKEEPAADGLASRIAHVDSIVLIQPFVVCVADDQLHML